MPGIYILGPICFNAFYSPLNGQSGKLDKQ